ncbi:neural Wiskott-Aldrich syndrome protein [Culex quinquefasciatus]|uniref:neural Wiskott-Aldrich syndrome protein n=1 Tax=Culex quinquefasciatus TaxID=7176 RepID=UPI0018E33A4A|nr:neural Wiskott-Aldrich syndrome protein [Culex quinquefasciatus]XP_038122750.1 neural Wiskott-Aldrich syndrome protein [Culex quinquefasciatus]XP_038122751.1 neural Wiskott-Aldrich syndrome protein [Culex quinquefasciatus]XP_038122752.1 neural Wiskott-Aldrich syndrome protein [Culex quinquefasciatus]XP_038122753.1 neural Wiskott-Aldrich syndrome protein [Culex quinquefasciatus]
MKQPATTDADRASKANRPSMLLTNEENEQLFGLLGRRCQTQCTAVVQLYLTQSPAHASWVKKWTGALCFVKDNIRKSYYFRLYCLKTNRQVWEQELYEKLDVTKPRPFLIVFEGAEGIVAFNFAMEDEATAFMNTTTSTLHNRNRRRDDRIKRNSTRKDPPPARPPPVSNQNNAFDNTVTLRHKPSFGAPTAAAFPQQPAAAAAMTPHQRPTKNKAKGKLRKEDIGMPSNFKHVTHVGWSPTSGFDLSGEEDTLKPFLEKAGVRDQHLKDRETREFIYDFIQNHKVLDTMKSEQSGNNRKQRPPPVPIRNHHEQQQTQQSPQQPNGNVQQRNPPPPPPNRTLPPLPATTPPKVNQAPSRPPPIQQQQQHKESPAPPAPAAPIPGPPPPPPPPPSAAAPPPPPPMGSMPKAQAPAIPVVVDDNRSALLDSIRKGTTLKPVDQSALSTGSGSGGGGSDLRGDLMSQIRSGGVVLRPVQDREQNAGPGTDRSSGSAGSGDCGTDALADALRRALAERGRVIRSSDEDDSDSNSANDDWDD